MVVGCSFPEHTFLGDDDFYRFGDAGSAGRRTDAGAAGSAGVESGAGGDPSTTVGKMEAGVDTGADPDAADAGDAFADATMSCNADLDTCDGECVDLMSDDDHCGSCKNSCTAPEVCSGGSCQSPCTDGFTNCDGTCVDLETDEGHCGDCTDAACASGELCEGGACVPDCGALSRCGTVCVDFAANDSYCGDCETDCTKQTPARVCSGGECLPDCVAPFIRCGNTCVDLTLDDDHCGDCSTSCKVGQACVAGSCEDLEEDCTNGTDDDEDSLADCADPDCAPGYTCATNPAGWTGPIALWSGKVGSAPSCSTSGGYSSAAVTANSGLVVPGYTCPACNCAASAGSFCDPLEFYYDDTTDCSAGVAWTVDADPDGNCTTLQLSRYSSGSIGPSAQSSQLIDPPESYAHGACTANQGAIQFPAARWNTEVRGCSGAGSGGGGCASGQCLPKPVAPFGTELCVFRSGVASCPPDYPARKPGAAQQYYQTILEGRSCSQCACGSPRCGGTVRTYTTTDCTGSFTNLDIDGDCTAIPVDPTPGGAGGSIDTRSIRYTNAGAVCANATSTLQGAPTPESPITVCCQSP